MLCSLVTLHFSMLGLWFSPPLYDSANAPAGSICRIRIGVSQLGPNRGHGDVSAEQASCRKFVAEFYSSYVDQSKKGDPLRVALRRRKANFSAEMVRMLNSDYAAAAKSPGEIVGLDFDPVLNTQDPAEKYLPSKVSQNGSRFLVDVVSVYAGKRSAVPAVIPELRHEHGRWVFTNFLYKSDGKVNDLLSMLKQMKADRKKRQ